MRLLARVSLQWKIFLLVGLGMAILVSTFSLLGINALRDSTNDALAGRLALAQVAASRLDLILEYSLSQMGKAAAFYPLDSNDSPSPEPEALARFLAAVQQGLPLTASYLALVDRQGMVVAIRPSVTLGLSPGSPAPVRGEVEAALAWGQPRVTGLVPYPGHSGFAYLLAPLKDGKEQAAGLLLAAIDPTDSNLSEYVRPLGLGETGYAEVVDGNGIVLASHSLDGLLRKEDHGERFATLIAEGRTTTGTCHSCHEASTDSALRPSKGSNGRQRTVLAFAPLSRAPWGVAIGQSESEALAGTNRLKRQLLLSGGLAVAVAVPLTWAGSRRLIQPLRVLTQSSHRIADGDLDSPIPRIGQDEVSALSRALEDMRHSLKASRQEADRMKADFLSNISHELRTPLTSIKISVESLLVAANDRPDDSALRQAPSTGSGRRQDSALRQAQDSAEVRLMRNIQRNTDRLNRLVGELVDMARLQSGAYKLSPAPVALADVIEESTETVKPLTEAKRQSVSVTISPDVPPSIEADRERLTQALVNLLVNASDFTPQQGRITVTAGRQSDMVVVAVADTGSGIPASEQGRIFDRFYSKPAPMRRGKTGLGLGLPIARGVVELHGGRMWVESTPGRGSTFYFSLPILMEVDHASADY